MKIRKPIFPLLLLLILSLAMAAVIVIVDFSQTKRSSDFRNNLISQNAAKSLNILESDMSRGFDMMQEKTAASVKLTISALQKLPEEEFLSGPRLFDNGVIVQIQNDEILCPPEYFWLFTDMDPDILRKEPTLYSVSYTKTNGESGLLSVITARHVRDDY